MDIEMLVNKDNLLDKNYVPKDLIYTDNNENNFHNFVDPNQKPAICREVYEHFLELREAMQKVGLDVIVDSGYRSYDYQQAVWDRNVEEKGLDLTKKFVAPPGASEHQTGLAVDVAIMRNGQYIEESTEEDEEIKWLMENAYKFGFILRYPKGKEKITGHNFEPWHYRYLGLELAKTIFEQGVTLEEYYQNKTKVRGRQ